jgi:hypothetical protein
MYDYKVLMHDKTIIKVNAYLNELELKTIKPGSNLQQCIKNHVISELSIKEFIELIVRTKKPQIFAESVMYGNGSDWNLTELSILGDICFVVPVTVYDNGKHYHPKAHAAPFNATLLYTPGALLRNGQGCIPADWEEVTVNDEVNFEAYYSLYERRLLPSFLHSNTIAESKNMKAVITIPGLGCGQFAGKFRGQLGNLLKDVLIKFLNNYSEQLSNIRAVYYDPYRECDNERHEINGISFLVRPFSKNNEEKSQLCNPQIYEENEDNFSNCDLFSFVAWDHVSWPGNDFYIGYRSTDDGVKAASTNSMAMMTGIEGNYNRKTNTYNPPENFKNWEHVVLNNNVHLDIKDNLIVLPSLTDLNIPVS